MRCGRKLKSPKAVSLGFGRCCYKKMMADKAFAEAARDMQPKDAGNGGNNGGINHE